MRIKMLSDKKGSPDGLRVVEYKKDQVYDMPNELAIVFIDQLKVAEKHSREEVLTPETLIDDPKPIETPENMVTEKEEIETPEVKPEKEEIKKPEKEKKKAKKKSKDK